MKRNIIIAVLALAGGIISYLMGRKNTNKFGEHVGQGNTKSHHLTNVFSKAKQHATSM